MAKKTPSPDVWLARLHLVPEAFGDTQASHLPFGYGAAVNAFAAAVTPEGEQRRPPLRQLNNLLMACLPTLTHGFEGPPGAERMLAVGTPNSPLILPDADRLHTLVLAWAKHWAKQYLGTHPTACEQFMATISQVRPTNWRQSTPTDLMYNLDRDSNLGFSAIPALLASWLHGQCLTID